MNPPEFQKTIYDYYKQSKRSFQWRETTNPYQILVSEVMLQQTQTSRVIEKYISFLKKFPTVEDLAQATTGAVLLEWQGLGYNRRGLNLHKAAQKIMNEFNGSVPERVDQLSSLPGIGVATASAIAAFAFNRPVSFIETNIRRVYIHFFFPDKEDVGDKELMPLIEETLDSKNPREWYYALMDYGAQLPRVTTNPNRRSKHYTVQSKFEGSKRQLRGAVVRQLTTIGPASLKTLTSITKRSKKEVEDCLKQLTREGFLHQEDEVFVVN